MYADTRGYDKAVIQAFIRFLQRVKQRDHLLTELCVPVFRLHTQGTVDMGLKNLLVAKCVAMDNMFMDESTWNHEADPNKRNLQILFDSVFESPAVRTICFDANMTNGYNNRFGNWTSIHNANRGRTFHCFARYIAQSYVDDEEFEGGFVHLYIMGCKNLRWIQ